MIVGIDPGLGGALVTLGSNSDTPFFYDTPILKIGKRKDYDILEMKRILFSINPLSCVDGCHVFLEKVHAMPQNGSIGNFRLGYGFGIWLALIVGVGLPYTLVIPQRWKKTLMDGMGKEKDASRQRAMQLFPKAVDKLNLKKHHGRADALLIAAFGRQSQLGR